MGSKFLFMLYSRLFDMQVLSLSVVQIAIYAEFRRDWVAALKFYETAYSLLQEVRRLSFFKMIHLAWSISVFYL